MAVREDGELHTKRHEGSTTVTSSLDAESLTLLSAIQQVAKELDGRLTWRRAGAQTVFEFSWPISKTNTTPSKNYSPKIWGGTKKIIKEKYTQTPNGYLSNQLLKSVEQRQNTPLVHRCILNPLHRCLVQGRAH